MNTLPKTVESSTKIRFQDCDPFNHLNNGSYFNYFMNHREDQLIEHYDIDVYELARSEGKSWVSSSNQIAYLKPAFLMETVVIESQLIHYTNSNIMVEMRMYNADKTQLKALIWCGFTYFNIQSQSKEFHTDKHMELFQNIMDRVDGSSFEERVKIIRSNPVMA